jgi:hypothetical protein
MCRSGVGVICRRTASPRQLARLRRRAVTAGLLAAAASAPAEPYIAWSRLVADEAAKQHSTPCAVALIAVAQVAMAEADNFVEPRFVSRLLVHGGEPLALPAQAVVASAAHHVLTAVLPMHRERLDGMLAQQLEAAAPASQRDGAASLGASLAQVVMVGLDAHALLASRCRGRPPR